MTSPQSLMNYTVRVEGGSGCLFQPSTENYTYVLTAAHVVAGKKKPKIELQYIDENGVLLTDKLDILDKPYIHTNPVKDAAIIKINRLAGFAGLLRSEEPEKYKNTYLCGHPQSRTAKNASFRENRLTLMHRTEHGYIEGEVMNNVRKREVVGQSGGGIIQQDQNQLFLLAGIQARMAMADQKESQNRVEFMPLSFFDEIIESDPDNLAPLFPPYISSLEHLIGDIFYLPNMTPEQKKLLLRNQLQSIARTLTAGFSPEKILKEQKEKLLINGTDKSLIAHKQLWVSYLELLSFNQLHSSKPLCYEDMEDLDKKNRIYFADTDEWTKKLEDIYKSDLSAIEKGGCIVISASRDITPTVVKMDQEAILDIASIPTAEMNISNTVTNPVQDLRIVHIYSFQDHILKNLDKFRHINLINTKSTLQDETKGIF